MLTAIHYNITLSRNGYTNRQRQRQVVVELYQDGQRRTINTHIHVRPQDFAGGCIQASCNDHDLLNRRLRRIVRRLMELEDEMNETGQQPTPSRLIDAYRNNLTPSATIAEWITSVITPSARKETTKATYRTLLTTIDAFCPGLRLTDINYDLLERFQNWMRREQHLAENTIIIRLKTLRCLVSEAVKRDVISPVSDPFRRLRIPEMTARREHLTEQELLVLEHTPLADPRLRHIRDAFLFCCYTGLRFSDFRHLTPANIQNPAFKTPLGEAPSALLILRQRKTGHPLQLPLGILFAGKPAAILARYPSIAHLASIGSNSQCNHDLRQVARIAGIRKHLHWHLARHTCGTLLNQRGLRMQEIQYILGHQRQATTERHYAETVFEQVQRSLAHAFPSPA